MGSSLVHSKPEGEWIEGGEWWWGGVWVREGCRLPAGEQMLWRTRGENSYLWGSEEGRRGFREDSYKAIGTHKIRHFQLQSPTELDQDSQKRTWGREGTEILKQYFTTFLLHNFRTLNWSNEKRSKHTQRFYHVFKASRCSSKKWGQKLENCCSTSRSWAPLAPAKTS